MGVLISTFQQGWFLPAPTLTEKNLPDQYGKVFIVTGANTGVGYQLTKILYGANATVYVAARNASKASAAIQSIAGAHPSSKGELHFLKLDLSDLSTIQASAAEFLAKENRLDVLWNNAGVMFPPDGSQSAQGYDLQYGTNILGPFLFTKLLWPVLKSTAAAAPSNTVRVCWAGSVVVDLGSPKPGGAMFEKDGSLQVARDSQSAYGVSKTANYFLGYEIGKRKRGDGVLSTSFNPGNLVTDLQRHVRTTLPAVLFKVVDLFLHEPIYGAYTELYAGLSSDLTIEKNQGAYIWPWGRVGPVRADIAAECKDGGKSQMLWEWCERETGKYTAA